MRNKGTPVKIFGIRIHPSVKLYKKRVLDDESYPVVINRALHFVKHCKSSVVDEIINFNRKNFGIKKVLECELSTTWLPVDTKKVYNRLKISKTIPLITFEALVLWLWAHPKKIPKSLIKMVN
jgi:hypothetical protein